MAIHVQSQDRGAAPGQAEPRQCRTHGPLLMVQRWLLPAKSFICIPGQEKGMRTKTSKPSFFCGGFTQAGQPPFNIRNISGHRALPRASRSEEGWVRQCCLSESPTEAQAQDSEQLWGSRKHP